MVEMASRLKAWKPLRTVPGQGFSKVCKCSVVFVIVSTPIWHSPSDAGDRIRDRVTDVLASLRTLSTQL